MNNKPRPKFFNQFHINYFKHLIEIGIEIEYFHYQRIASVFRPEFGFTDGMMYAFGCCEAARRQIKEQSKKAA